MNKAYDTKRESNFATDSYLGTEPQFESATDMNTQQTVELKIEQLEKRTKHVLAKIYIPYSLDRVWQVLTNYEAFADFMPSLNECRRLDPSSEGIRIEQVRTKSFMGMSFSASSIFDIEEKFPHEIHYRLVEGDMKALSGYWRLKQKQLENGKAVVELIYDFTVCPKRIFPMALVEHILSHDIPDTMVAIRERVAQLYDS